MGIDKKKRRFVIQRDGSICQGCGCLCRDELRNGRGKCAYVREILCPIGYDRTFTVYRASIDHITPTCLGGTDDIGNLQLLCVGCNAAKSNSAKGLKWRRNDPRN